MQLIFGKDNADALRDRYTVLELETLTVGEQTLDVYCVVPAEKIALTEISTVEQSTKLHNEFVSGLRNKNYKLCSDLYVHLIGKFGGELDSFYEEIAKRIQQN